MDILADHTEARRNEASALLGGADLNPPSRSRHTLDQCGSRSASDLSAITPRYLHNTCQSKYAGSQRPLIHLLGARRQTLTHGCCPPGTEELGLRRLPAASRGRNTYAAGTRYFLLVAAYERPVTQGPWLSLFSTRGLGLKVRVEFSLWSALDRPWKSRQGRKTWASQDEELSRTCRTGAATQPKKSTWVPRPHEPPNSFRHTGCRTPPEWELQWVKGEWVLHVRLQAAGPLEPSTLVIEGLDLLLGSRRFHPHPPPSTVHRPKPHPSPHPSFPG